MTRAEKACVAVMRNQYDEQVELNQRLRKLLQRLAKRFDGVFYQQMDPALIKDLFEAKVLLYSSPKS